MATQPTDGGMKNGSSVGIGTRCMHVIERFAPTCNAQSVLINKKFLHRSSDGSLLRVRCWLGMTAKLAMTTQIGIFVAGLKTFAVYLRSPVPTSSEFA